jgi:iron complex outermembrane receptor protein
MMNRSRVRTGVGRIRVFVGASTLALMTAGPIAAQTASRPPPAAALDEIIVTARKREETIMKAPVIIQAFSAAKLEQLNIRDMYLFSQIAPGLTISPAASPVGAVVFLRGVGNGDSGVYIDQSVALNIDGVNLNHGSALRNALFDVSQIEVLKGPQALFFGKSSSAGIIAIKSADPTPDFQSKVSVGYGFKNDEKDVDAMISGPLSDQLGFRLAGIFDDAGGYFINANPGATHKTTPNDRTYGGRLTLKFDNASNLRGRIKVAYTDFYTNGVNGLLGQRVCTLGAAQQQPFGRYDDCRIDEVNSGRLDRSNPYVPGNYAFGSPAFATGLPFPIFRDGGVYDSNKILTTALNLDADLTRALTVSSVTGYTYSHSAEAYVSGAGGAAAFNFGDEIKRTDWSQELRLTSNFKESWVNFMIGGYYANGRNGSEYLNVFFPSTLTVDNYALFHTKSKSAFGQIILSPFIKWELSAGLRYTADDKYFSSLISNSNLPRNPIPAGQQIGLIDPALTKYRQTNTSPEVTLTYRPTDDFTAFLSYKQGYKAPGFNLNTVGTRFVPTSASDLATISPYGGEQVKGVEGGIKVAVLDNRLNLTADAYHYKYDGLQVSFVINNALGNTFVTSNAATATVAGFELGGAFRPESIEGLTLNGFVNYNHAKYDSFPNAFCYGGQYEATGCFNLDGTPVVRSSTGVQNLGGRPLRRAPQFVGTFGIDYIRAVSAAYNAGLSVNSNFSSGYYATAEENPNGYQKSYGLFDATLRLSHGDGLWDIELIGRNLTNKLYYTGGVDGGQITSHVRADVAVYTNRPREIMLRFTVRPRF